MANDGSLHYRNQPGTDAEADYEELLAAAWEALDPDLRSRKVLLPGAEVQVAADLSRKGSNLSRIGSGLSRSGSKKERQVEEVAPGVVAVDIGKLAAPHRALLLDRALRTRDMDNERFLTAVRQRLDRVGIKLPQVEVRFEGLSVAARAESAGRALPSIFNSYRNWAEEWLQRLGLLRRQQRQVSVLRGCSGVLRPGRLALLLGPPGSGKTTLLKALAGKLGTSANLQVEGCVTFNGYGFDEFVVGRTAAYVDQRDNHIAELTVRETLDFAARVQGGGHDEIDELRAREKEQGIEPDREIDAFMRASLRSGKRHSIRTDYTLRLLGLEVCADTIVGSHMVRGISGGQKKRVTTGEIVVGPCQTLLMDEISTGLDASTTFQIMRCLANVAHMREATLLVSLLQPPPETFELFDDVLLLSDGILVYSGPREEVVPFFEGLGFRLPPRKGVADFLQEITSAKDQQQYWGNPDKPWRYIPPAEIAAAYGAHPIGKAAAEELATPAERTDKGAAALVHEEHALPFWRSLKACMRREWTLMIRHRVVYIYRLAQLFIVAFAASTMFIRTRMGTTSLQDGRWFLGFLFYSCYFLMASGWSELSITLGNLGVFYKQRDNLFHRVSAFTLPTTLLRIPYSLICAGFWAAMTYWVVGMAPSAGRFFIFLLIVLLVHQTAITIFRAIGAVLRAVVLANVGAFLFIGSALLFNGFIIQQGNLRGWWIWAYWCNPLSYAMRAVVLNEFTAPRWQTPLAPGSSLTVGQAVLQENGFDHASWWIGAAVGILVGYIVLFNVVVIVALKLLSEPNERKAVFKEEEEQTQPAESPSAETNGLNGASNGVSPEDHLSNGTHDAGTKHTSPALDGRKPDDTAQHNGPYASAQQITSQPLPSAANAAAADAAQQARQRSHSAASTSDSSATAAPHTAVDVGEHGMVLPFDPITLTFRDVHYFVPMPGGGSGQELELLRGISGAFRPGVLTALMGASGAGKTTFMDVLAGRKTAGRSTGDIRVNGHPQDHRTFARISGYVEQFDVHSPQATVREALWFSARLRLAPEIDNTALRNFLKEVMQLVELTPLEMALVGVPGISGLSVEQRKRLTIAVELVANPSIVFMDEPTSGLDARAAAIVMRVVRNIVNTGRTIACTIHQPAIDIFETFDEMLLLKRGGEVIYNGPLGHQSAHMVAYFQGHQGVRPITEGYNPATWMLEISTISAEQRVGDFGALYRKSQLARGTEALLDELEQPAPGSQPLHFATAYPQSLPRQYLIILTKNLVCYWRYPQYNSVRFSFTAGFAFILGTVFWRVGMHRSTETQVLQIIASQYLAALILGFTNSATIQPVATLERPVFYRERAAGFYATMPYAIAQGTVEVPYVLVQALIYSLITYFLIHLEVDAGKFFWYTLFMVLTLLYYTYYGLLAVLLCPSLQMSAVASTLFYAIWSLFAGFLLTKPHIPGWYIWYYYLCPVAWTLYGISVTQLGNVTTLMALSQGGQVPVNEYVQQYFGFHYGMRGWVVLILIGFILVFRVACIVALKKLNFQKR